MQNYCWVSWCHGVGVIISGGCGLFRVSWCEVVLICSISGGCGLCSVGVVFAARVGVVLTGEVCPLQSVAMHTKVYTGCNEYREGLFMLLYISLKGYYCQTYFLTAIRTHTHTMVCGLVDECAVQTVWIGY